MNSFFNVPKLDTSFVKSKSIFFFLTEMLIGVIFKLPDDIVAGNYIKEHSST
ncbi:hypothetical protein JCM6294_769 [Bacteroides pyogenes DSM 20611 = JCM 6294]|uniref:Uncharacterized protein n=1 Tax=Bacteroides pyogenes DSM 20611 = JCM 6294 TaxID=1121100 RepID=W4PF01_9BACE|nr:hypothetical protein JCM6294_769 [Bacteroides pyogenes DSM 20611 = JCM 6294]